VQAFSQIAATPALEEEAGLPKSHMAVKRFMDLLFLSTAGDVTLSQQAPLAFSDIEVKLTA